MSRCESAIYRLVILCCVAARVFALTADGYCEEIDHWSFKPITDSPPPNCRRIDLVETPVDRFVLAKLDQEGFDPAPPADKRTLLRRVTYDLVGLPPTAEDVEAFLADNSPQAYERVVDRLLASPRHGERWGRYWLDLARYADTKGYIYDGREDRRFFHSHIYRDWVIGALNRDLPYDRFLREQIAGDQLASDDDKSPLAAMGFLTLGRRFAGNGYEIIDDRIDTVCRTTMGLTVSFARCHDHKFDPITSGDYYSLYSIFAGSYDAVTPLASLPSSPTPEHTAFADELHKRQSEYDNYLKTRSEEVIAKVRARSADYLKAVLTVETLPTEHEYRFLDAEDLNPVFVRQWHAFLIRQQSEFDPLFEPWRALTDASEGEFAGRFSEWFTANRSKLNGRISEALAAELPTTKEQLAERLGRTFEAVNQEWLAATQAGGAEPPSALPDESAEAVRQALYGPRSPIHIPEGHSDVLEWCFDEPTRVEMGKRQQAVEQWLVDAPVNTSHVVYLADRAQQPEPRIFENGNPAVKGDAAPRGFVEVLAACAEGSFESGSGRLALADAIVHPQNPLTARVIVNRVWQHHFGAPLVETPSDFGFRSEPPTHPELLDWLARRFMADGWSLKSLHRLIVLSYAYRQSNQASELALARDPDNRLLSRTNRRRLDYEALHDSLAAASGWIDPVLGGRPVQPGAESPPRRAVYAFVDRLNVPAVMRTFDVASPDAHSPERHVTTIPQQALYLMNSPQLIERVRALMSRREIVQAASDEERMEALYEIVFARAPANRERAIGLQVATAALAEAVVPPPAIWLCGQAAYDASQGVLSDFAPLPTFADAAWRDTNDSARLTAAGGAAREGEKTLVRRWISPIAGTVRVTGAIEHSADQGDGIRAIVVSSRAGELAAFNVKKSTAEATLTNIAVEAGDTLDFVVLSRASAEGDEFKWSPVVRREGEPKAGERLEWSAAADFSGPPPTPLTPWEKYAQVLLLTNEFAFVD